MNISERSIVERLVEVLDALCPTHHKRTKGLIAEARKMLEQPDWVRVDDALPVIPDGERNVAIWVFGGKHCERWPLRTNFDYEGFWPEDAITHWRYAEPTPQPPEQGK